MFSGKRFRYTYYNRSDGPIHASIEALARTVSVSLSVPSLPGPVERTLDYFWQSVCPSVGHGKDRIFGPACIQCIFGWNSEHNMWKTSHSCTAKCKFLEDLAVHVGYPTSMKWNFTITPCTPNIRNLILCERMSISNTADCKSILASQGCPVMSPNYKYLTTHRGKKKRKKKNVLHPTTTTTSQPLRTALY